MTVMRSVNNPSHILGNCHNIGQVWWVFHTTSHHHTQHINKQEFFKIIIYSYILFIEPTAKALSLHHYTYYIQGYNGTQKVYIATQAPLESTVSDFWTMVWESQSQVVVMLMQQIEDGQVC